MSIFEKNCWLQRTPLEVGLILVLIVSVPFLITMITVYAILLSQRCPNCSIRCLDFCAKMSSASSVTSMFLELHPNVSLPKLAEKYEICPEYMLKYFEQKVDHAFVAAVVEDVYVDDVTRQRYLCAAAIITFKWVVSSSNCFEGGNHSYANVTRMFVRAGSNYWLRGGSVHAVEQIMFADETIPATVAAIKLKTEFPRLSSIRPIMLSRTSVFKDFGVAEIYNWKSNDSMPLEFRKKFVKLESEASIIFKDVQCKTKVHGQAHVFCSQSIMPKNASCMVYSGFPVTRARILLGINIGGFCDSKYGFVYLVYNIVKALPWLEEHSGVYVEHL